MKHFLELNYYQFPTNNLSDILNKAKANVGYLFFLSKYYLKTTAIFQGLDNEALNKDTVIFLLLEAKGFNRFSHFIRLHQKVISLKPDYILIHGLRYGLYSFFLKKILPNSIIIVQVHGFARAPKRIKKMLYKWISLFVDGYIFTGRNNAKDWIETHVFPKEKLFEVMEGSTDFCLDKKSIKQKGSFLWVGRLDKNKDPLTILNAFKDYLNFNPEARLSMVYNDNTLLSDVKNLLNNSIKLKQSVFLIGELDHVALQKLYRKSQFFVLGSHYEGSGYALLEAMACGCIPIVTKIPSFKFMTDNGSCALLFQSGNKQGLLAQLKQTDKIDLIDYQQKVIAQFQNKLSFKAIANDVFKAFKELSNRKDCK